MRSILSVFALLVLAANVQGQNKAFPTQIKAGLSDHATVSGDTVYFMLPGDKRSNNLARFFNRNLRMPYVNGTIELETGTCSLHFVLDTTGSVVHSWCEQISNEMIAKEVLRVVQKLGKMQPTTIGGRPVKTEIEMSFEFYLELKPEGITIANTRADIVVVGYPPQRKETTK